MNLFPWRKPSTKVSDDEKNSLVTIPDRTWTKIFDWLPGRWQQDSPLDTDTSVVTHPTVYACVSRIGSDIGKLMPTTQSWDTEARIWATKKMPRFLDLLFRPNSYQTHIEFKEWWMFSKLLHGNTYVLIIRDGLEKIKGLQIMDPSRVTPLVSDEGEVFYRLDPDNLAGVQFGQVIVPATEVIHDRMNAFFHPLVGLSPLYAAKVAAQQGLAIQKDARKFFENGAQPSGILVAPGPIEPSTAERLKEYWQAKFTGDNAGNIAVLGDGMKYESMRMTSVDSQTIAQLDWTAETICSVFGVPPHKVGVGQMPTHDNIEALTQAYYSDGLQTHIEKMELTLARGLGMPVGARIELDLDGLFRMDSSRKMDYLTKAVSGSILAPNEARRKLNMEPIEGGDTVYLQQQYYSLEALAQRDEGNPLAVSAQATPSAPSAEDPESDPVPADDGEDAGTEDLKSFVDVLTNLTKACPL